MKSTNPATFTVLKCSYCDNSLSISTRGELPENLLESLKKIKQVEDMLSTLLLRTWEKIVFLGAEVVKKAKNLTKIILKFEKSIKTLSEINAVCLSHTDKTEVGKKLKTTNRVDAAIMAANHAVENDIPVVKAFYMQGNSEGMVHIVNYNVFTKGINPGDTKVFERFILKTKCLLYK